jgi:hypothetical protein
MSWLNRLAERQMQKARLKGELQGLKGEGKPLPDYTADAFVTPGEAMGFRIMAEAGVLPEEIVLKKEAARLMAELATITNPEARKAMMARIADVQMRQAMAEEARRAFLRG